MKILLPGTRNRFHWDRSSADEMMSFGRWIFVSTLLTFLAMQADRLIFGKLITLTDLGVYGVAAMMASRNEARVPALPAVGCTSPGATQLTRTPCGPTSAARLRLKPTSADLAVP